MRTYWGTGVGRVQESFTPLVMYISILWTGNAGLMCARVLFLSLMSVGYLTIRWASLPNEVRGEKVLDSDTDLFMLKFKSSCWQDLLE